MVYLLYEIILENCSIFIIKMKVKASERFFSPLRLTQIYFSEWLDLSILFDIFSFA